MTMSPASKDLPKAVTVSSVGLPEGTITQAMRGGDSFAASSSRLEAVSAP